MPPSLRDASYLWDIVDSCRLAIEATRELDLGEVLHERIWRIVREELPRLIERLEPELPDSPRPVE